MFTSLKDAAHEFRISFKPSDLSTPQNHRRARAYMTWFDHEPLRRVWTNQFEIASGVYRSNQPPAKRIPQLAQMGIKTIITLRGDRPNPFYMLEAEACAAHGITLEAVTLQASKLPPAAELKKLIHLFEAVQGPFLFHCKSGSDRTGLAAALYLHLFEGHPMDQALDQLAFKYVHLRWSKKGIHPFMLAFYDAWQAETGKDFIAFLDEVYDPEAITQDFEHAPFWRKLLWRWEF